LSRDRRPTPSYDPEISSLDPNMSGAHYLDNGYTVGPYIHRLVHNTYLLQKIEPGVSNGHMPDDISFS